MGKAVTKPVRMSEMGTERLFARDAAYLWLLAQVSHSEDIVYPASAVAMMRY